MQLPSREYIYSVMMARSKEIKRNIYGEEFKIGDRVGGGESEEDHEHGTVVDIKGGHVSVLWDQGVLTTQTGSLLTIGDEDECSLCNMQLEH